jgi:hypothetical protein
MARGWESKSVEEQQSQAAASKSEFRARLTPAEAEKARQTELLLLSRKQVLHQLEMATNPLQRKMLESALEDLDRRLESQSSTPSMSPKT